MVKRRRISDLCPDRADRARSKIHQRLRELIRHILNLIRNDNPTDIHYRLPPDRPFHNCLRH
jgi:hypothetical protein